MSKRSPAYAAPEDGLFSAPNPADVTPNKQIQDNPELYPDPNAVLQLTKGVSGTPLYGGASPRQFASPAQARGMISGGNGQQQPLQQSILRTLWNGKQMTPQGAPMQKAVAPGPAAVNTLAHQGAMQAPGGKMAPPIGAGAPGIPSAQDIQASQVRQPVPQVVPGRKPFAVR